MNAWPVLPPDLGSTLVGVLTGRDAQVVQRWHSARSSEELGETVREAGWQFAHLDSALAQSKHETLVALGRALDFPPHYGQNFDALADCLDDLLDPAQDLAPDAGPAGVVLVWDAWSILAAAEPRTFGVLVEIFTEHTGRPRPFAVLMRDV